MSCDTNESAQAVIGNALATINAYAQQYADISNNKNVDPATSQLNALHTDLSKQVNILNAEIQELKGSVERYDRDFVDLEATTTPNTSSIHTMDDYTMMVLLLSYLLFAVAVVFWYSHTNYYTITAIGASVGVMTLVSFLLIVLAIIVL
jgi:hypothetical protein